MSNEIHPTASIPDSVVMGQYNVIGAHVTISGFKGQACGPVILGDCNVIHEHTRAMVGPEGWEAGDWNMIHNRCFIGGPGKFVMGHNCWLGQECWLDSTGGLTLGNGVTCGIRTAIWTHIARGEQIEGWRYGMKPVCLEDDVWLVGDSVHVSPGVTMGARSAALARAVVTKDTKSDVVYAGVPAQPLGLRLKRSVTPGEKWEMMVRWVREFAQGSRTTWSMHLEKRLMSVSGLPTPDTYGTQRLYIGFGQQGVPVSDSVTYFDLAAKAYTKRLTQLERDFIHFLKSNRARFLPA